MNLETCDQSDEDTWPLQQKYKDKDKDNDRDNGKKQMFGYCIYFSVASLFQVIWRLMSSTSTFGLFTFTKIIRQDEASTSKEI